jgi:hypothetical protein
MKTILFYYRCYSRQPFMPRIRITRSFSARKSDPTFRLPGTDSVCRYCYQRPGIGDLPLKNVLRLKLRDSLQVLFRFSGYRRR